MKRLLNRGHLGNYGFINYRFYGCGGPTFFILLNHGGNLNCRKLIRSVGIKERISRSDLYLPFSGNGGQNPSCSDLYLPFCGNEGRISRSDLYLPFSGNEGQDQSQ